MLKKIIVGAVLVTIFGILILGAVNRSLAKGNSENTNVIEDSYSSVVIDSISDQHNGRNGANQVSEIGHAAEEITLPPINGDGLSEGDKAGLIYMVEEEKLANNIYTAFYSQYGTQFFQNISQSELTHSEALKTLISRYGLTDPASSEMGVFTNPDLQAMYKELISRGNQSLAEAVKVGAVIEEIDILDLQEDLIQNDNADIQQIYQNLLKGSENHLRAFIAKYQQQTGAAYTPQYLSLEDYQAIINADTPVGGQIPGVGGGNGGYRGGRP